jgi:uncharacterized delta-60 repeat protein
VGLLLLPLPVVALGSGDLDPSFGGHGTVLTDFDGGSPDTLAALALQPDGKIVVAGWSDASYDFAVARYLPNGTPDGTFRSHGTVLTNFGSSGFDEAFALALQADGKIVVAGDSAASGTNDFALARYLSNGSLDV